LSLAIHLDVQSDVYDPDDMTRKESEVGFALDYQRFEYGQGNE
jgi:hypothetical protein